MLSWILIREYDATLCAERCLASVASDLVVTSISDDYVSTPWAFPSLFTHMGKIHKLCKKLCFMCSRLSSVDCLLLVPTSYLIIVEQPTFIGCKVIVACDHLAALPAELATATLADHLVATFRLLDGGSTLRAVARCPLQVAECEQLSLSCFCLLTRPFGTLLQGPHLIIPVCTRSARVEHTKTLATETEEAHFALGHVVFVLYAWHMIAISIAPRAEHDVLHGVQTTLQTQLLPLPQHCRVFAKECAEVVHTEGLIASSRWASQRA